MNTGRTILVTSAVVAGIAWCAWAADRKPAEPSVSSLTRQVAALESRVEELEAQMSQMGAAILANSRPDHHGVLRDATGQPVGLWGTDPNNRIMKADIE